MTRRLVTWLAIAVCLQVGVIALVYWSGSEPDTVTADGTTALLHLPRERINHIGVTDAGGNSIALARRNGQWLIDAESLPAVASVAERLLDALAQPSGFPVARSDSARERFEVNEEHFQRRIILRSHSNSTGPDPADGADTATFYLGTSPGMRRVHARRGDRTAIQTITLSTFDVPATVDGWLDATLLAVNALQRVVIADHVWRKRGGAWTASVASDPENMVPSEALEALEALVQALETLQVTGVVAAADKVDMTAQPAFEFTVSGAAEAVTLRLAPMTEDEEARIYSSQFERWFTLSDFDRDRLAGALDKLKADAPTLL